MDPQAQPADVAKSLGSLRGRERTKAVKAMARQLGVRESTVYRWLAKYDHSASAQRRVERRRVKHLARSCGVTPATWRRWERLGQLVETPLGVMTTSEIRVIFPGEPCA